MFNKILSKAVSKDKTRQYLSCIYYNKSTGEYVATNGCILLIEKTADIYDTDKFLSPRTGLPVDNGCTFPDYRSVIPADGDIITDRVFKTYIRTEKSKHTINKIVQIRNMFFDFNYLKTIIDFVGSDFILTMSCPTKPLKFISSDGLRTALLMPIIRVDLSDYTSAEDIDISADKHTRLRAAKYVYIAFDKSGAVRGVFNKESDARKESFGLVKEFPLI